MALYGNLRNYEFMKDADDIRGAAIYGANDEKLGKIDDIIFDHSDGDLRYVVVDAAGWLQTRKFLVPARLITIREEGDEDFHINMTKEQIERLPEYREESLQEDGLWKEYERGYNGALTDGPVLHRAGSTHMVTPQPYGQSGEQGTLETEHSGVDATLPRLENEETVTMSRSEFLKEGTLRSEYDAPDEREPLDGNFMDSGKVSMDVSPAPDGGNRFRAFQERLRHEREEIMRRREQEKKDKRDGEAA